MQKRINPSLWARKKYPRHISNDVTPRKILHDELLSLQETITRQPLAVREGELRNLLESSCLQNRKIKDATQLAEIYRQSIILFIDLGNYDLARELCYTQIQTMVRQSDKNGDFQLKKYVFQPWLQLIKIDRLEGKTYDAFRKLKTLDDANQVEWMIGENRLLRHSLFDALCQDSILYHEIMSQSFIERIQLYLGTKRYHDAFHFMQNNKLRMEKLNGGIIQEIFAIMYANTGRINEAFTMLAYKNSNNPLIERMLKLREYEMRIQLTRDKTTMTKLNKQYLVCMNLIKLSDVRVHDIIFALHTARVMQIMGATMNLSRLIYFCLEAAINLNDEILKAECLIRLYGLTLDLKAKKIVEDLMIKHYYQTQYLEARKKMLSCLEDLKYVETKNNDQTMKPLFEDILALSL